MSFFKFDMKDFAKKLDKRLKENKVKTYVSRATLMVEGTAKESIQKGGTGILYEKYKPRRSHRASAPKEPPATDTGFLVSQISMNVKKEANGVIVGQVISAAPYSAHLEFGTTNMTERPFMQPALEKNRRKIQALFNQGILK
tara:strand:- start:213 stop:638 length:426 start_codon:yes stop_codon:yes gene_type:complete